MIGGDADGSLRFWDAASGAKLWTLQVHKSAVIGVHLEGVDIVTRGFAGEISRWTLPQSGAVIEACAHPPPPALPSRDEETTRKLVFAQRDRSGVRWVATGRKAWLFVGSDDHAQAAGNLLTLVASARLHKLDPEPYLCDLFRVLPQ